jgi:hypothetical protein
MPDLETDIGRMTSGLRDNAEDIFKIWMFQPARHVDFGEREIRDIEDTIIGLNAVLRQRNRKPRLVSNG